MRLPNWNRKQWLIAGGAAALGLGFLFRRQIITAGGVVLDAAKREIFEAIIPDGARPHAAVILQVADEQNTDPLLIVALGEQETKWTWGDGYAPKGDPRGTGDGGHGHGIMQIDDRTWGDWLASHDWGDPHTNITKGVQILKSNLSYFAGKGLVGSDQLSAALAAYNHGPGNVWKNIQANRDVDYGTAHNNYSASVSAILADLTSAFNAAAV